VENQEKNTMRVRFLGAIGTVTGSCTLLEYYDCAENTKSYFLIDAGAFQNESNAELNEERIKTLKYFAKKIKCIFITHAHFDHIGILPDIIRYGFKGKVYCTQATHELIEPMLTSVSYDHHEIERISNLLKKIKFIEIDGEKKENNGFGQTTVPLKNNLFFGYLRSSHILGSCTFYFQWTERNYPEEVSCNEIEWKYLYFSGDIGAVSDKIPANIIYKGHQTPYWDKYEKCIIMESTYGDRIRNKDDIIQKKNRKLFEIIDTSIKEQRIVIIPAFALDRAQQILFDLFCTYQEMMKVTDGVEDDRDWSRIIQSLSRGVSLSVDTLPQVIRVLTDNEDLQEKLDGEFKFILENYEGKNRDQKIDKILETYEIKKPKTPQFNYFVDSPLAEKVNNIYEKHLADGAYSKKYDKRKYKYITDVFLQKIGFLNDDKLSLTIKDRLGFLRRTNKSKEKIKRNERIQIIVTASGMCDEGKVVTYLENNLTNENATIVLTGFQAKDTNGAILKKLFNNEYDEKQKKSISLKLQNKDITLCDIKCKIEDMSEYYSGHADQEQLLDFITPDKTKLKLDEKLGKIYVLLNHGTDIARETLKEKIEEKNKDIKVTLPEFNKWLNVATIEYEPEDIEFNSETNKFNFTKVGDIHIYYPIEYDEEKIQSIIDYINDLE